jgi:hypothetical protein
MGRANATSTSNQNNLHGQGLRALFAGLFDESKLAIRRPIRRSREPAVPGTEPQKDAFAADTQFSRGFVRGDSMPNAETDVFGPGPSIVPSRIPASMPASISAKPPAMSDDECLVRLAQAVKDHDSDRLDEVARLIGRLVVPIE